MAVLASRRRGQANCKLRFDLPHHLFETVPGNTVLHFAFTLQALKQGYVDHSGPTVLTTDDLTDSFGRKIQKHCETCAPLFEQLLAVD